MGFMQQKQGRYYFFAVIFLVLSNFADTSENAAMKRKKRTKIKNFSPE